MLKLTLIHYINWIKTTGKENKRFYLENKNMEKGIWVLMNARCKTHLYLELSGWINDLIMQKWFEMVVINYRNLKHSKQLSKTRNPKLRTLINYFNLAKHKGSVTP